MWCGNGEMESTFGGGPNPRAGHIAVPVANERHAKTIKRPTSLANSEKIGQNLAGMLLVGESIDRRNATVGRKILHILLCKGADHRAVQHSPHHTSGILDRFPTTELDIRRCQKNRIPTQLTDAHFKGNTSSCRGFGKNQPPALVAQRL